MDWISNTCSNRSCTDHLVGSLISEVVADPAKSIDALIPKPAEGLIDVENAISLALSKITTHGVETRWSDAAMPTGAVAKSSRRS